MQNMSEPIYAVRAEKLDKEFVLPSAPEPITASIRKLLSARAQGSESPVNQGRLKALSAVSFEIVRGEMVGLIGHNGAGKTTLLKLIAGIYAPNSGSIESTGSKVLLSGLGVGMVDDLTVKDNIHLYGSLCGLQQDRILGVYHEILDWAQLAKFEHTPLRNLSTGMRARLGFSIAMHNTAEILLIDEALSAGDKQFDAKCAEYFRALASRKTTAIVSTHDMSFVREHCKSTLWLEKGSLLAFGPTEQVLSQYIHDT